MYRKMMIYIYISSGSILPAYYKLRLEESMNPHFPDDSLRDLLLSLMVDIAGNEIFARPQTISSGLISQ